jgi:hypothetical protein
MNERGNFSEKYSAKKNVAEDKFVILRSRNFVIYRSPNIDMKM